MYVCKSCAMLNFKGLLIKFIDQRNSFLHIITILFFELFIIVRCEKNRVFGTFFFRDFSDSNQYCQFILNEKKIQYIGTSAHFLRLSAIFLNFDGNL